MGLTEGDWYFGYAQKFDVVMTGKLAEPDNAIVDVGIFVGSSADPLLVLADAAEMDQGVLSLTYLFILSFVNIF